MTKQNFSDWIRKELKERGWTLRELARQSSLTPSAISDQLSFDRVPSLDMCKALAKAFDKPVIDVLILAGHLTPSSSWSEEESELRDLFNTLTTTERRALIAVGKALKENRGPYAP